VGSGSDIVLHTSSSAKPRHLRAQAGFVNEDEVRRIEIELAGELVLATLQKVGTLLIQEIYGFFVTVQPCSAATHRARYGQWKRLSPHAIAGRSRWAHEPPRRPHLKGVNRPAHALTIQAMAGEIPIPKRAAAERADMPTP
jgi:hypothetical protein